MKMFVVALCLLVFGAVMLISNVKEILRQPEPYTSPSQQAVIMPRFYRLKHWRIVAGHPAAAT